MLSLPVLTLAAALGAGDAVLLDFTASWCGPCQTMAPVVERLRQEGYPIRPIDVDRQPQLALQYGVRAVPCFVMVARGREVDRVEGAASYDRLRRMFERAQVRPALPAAEPPRASAPPPLAPPSAAAAAMQGPGQASSSGEDAAVERARRATVRLRIEDAQGRSYGTGTIIDTHGDEALILTCGHLFRQAGPNGQVLVDLFAPQRRRDAPGQLIHYDLQRDIGFVAVRPGMPVTPAPVAPPDYRVRLGDAVFTLGCDEGRDPTVRRSRISAIDKYLGSPNIEVAGQPVDGRSGGGLFSADGYVIGVCNAADPADDEGIYAALATVHQQLDLIGQRRIYAAPASEALAQAGPPEAAGPTPARSAAEPPPSLPAIAPPPAAPAAAGLTPAAPGPDTEVICIIRPRHSSAAGRILVLENPSPQLLDQLERLAQATPAPAAGAVAARGDPPAAAAQTAQVPQAAVYRGQSTR